MNLIIKKIIVGPIQANCYILSLKNSPSCILIDPGEDPQKIDKYLKQNNLIPEFIINTHGHYDHIGANNFFKQKYPKAILAIHENGKEMLEDPGKNFSTWAGHNFSSCAADQLLKDNDVINWGKIKIRVIHTPGHTPCGICLLVNEHLFSGDTLFYESVGRTDLPEGSSKNIIQNIKEKLFILDPQTKVYPGHGPETTIGHEKIHNPFCK